MATRVVRPIALALLLSAPVSAANITVNTTVDLDSADADCALREAIVAANTNAAHNGCAAGTGTSDRIVFALALPATITLTGDLPTISESVAIVGPGVDQLTIDGVDDYRILVFREPTDDDPWFVVSGLRLTRGTNLGGNGGGALEAWGTLRLSDCELSDSATDAVGGGLGLFGGGRVERCRIFGNSTSAPPGGGGISVQGPGAFELVDSTVAANTATHEASGGGGLRTQEVGSLSVLRSTLSGNSTGTSGGGLEAAPGFFDATTYFVEIESSTITLNECNAVNTGNFGCGGGVRFAEGIGSTLDVSIRNSVIAENVDLVGPTLHHDVVLPVSAGLVFVSGGFNLIGENPGAIDAFPDGGPNANGDFVGTSAARIDPELTALGDNGGPTPTHGFVAMNPHPLVDQGSCPGELADQRGYGNGTTKLRIVDLGPVANNPNGDGCDIGAVEGSITELVPSAIFADGFESGRLLFWSSDVQ